MQKDLLLKVKFRCLLNTMAQKRKGISLLAIWDENLKRNPNEDT